MNLSLSNLVEERDKREFNGVWIRLNPRYKRQEEKNQRIERSVGTHVEIFWNRPKDVGQARKKM